MTEAVSKQKKPDPCSFVIFGVSGDLTHRLVIPALYNLAATDLLPDKFCVVGITRTAMSNQALRDSLMQGLHKFATRTVDDRIAGLGFRKRSCALNTTKYGRYFIHKDLLARRCDPSHACCDRGAQAPPR